MGADHCGLVPLISFKSHNIFFSSPTSLCPKLSFYKLIIILPNNVGHIYTWIHSA